MNVLITVAFEGYPDGLTRTFYREGDTPIVPEDFGRMIIDKGLAVAVEQPAKSENNKGVAK